MNRRPLMGILGAMGCAAPIEYDTSVPRTSVEEPEPPAAVAWLGDNPTLQGGDPVVGLTTTLIAAPVPEGASVTLSVSWTGVDDGPCGGDALCLDLPAQVGTATAGPDESVAIAFSVPNGVTAKLVWFQVVAVDLAGARATSPVVMRSVALPRDPTGVSFRASGLEAGIAVPLGGAGHAAGLAWADVNQDWWPDLIVSNGSGLPHYLFVNRGDGTFADQSAAIAKPDLLAEDAGVTALDIDADGRVDLLFPVDAPTWVEEGPDLLGGPNTLYRNLGAGLFEEVGAAWGVVDPRGARTSSATASDRDGDGFVDLFLGTWSPGDAVIEPPGDRLLASTGAQFQEYVDVVDLTGSGRDTSAVLWLDTQRDGFVDLVNTKLDPLGVQVHRADAASAYDLLPAGARASAFGLANGDFDADGLWDLYVWGDVDPKSLAASGVLTGIGDGTFGQFSCETEGGCLGYPGGAAAVADFDRDRRDDVLVAGAAASVHLLMNDGGRWLVEHLDPTLPNFAGAQALAAVDFDGDLDVDVASWSAAGGVELAANLGTDVNSGIQVGLVSPGRVAAGSLVTVAGVVESQRLVGGLPWVDAGIGLATSATVTVTWPDGTVSVAEAQAGDLTLIEYGAGLVVEILTGTASLSQATGTLTVEVNSNYGGRSHITTDFGELAWDPDTLGFRWEGPIDSVPATLTVQSDRGSVVVLPVVLAP